MPSTNIIGSSADELWKSFTTPQQIFLVSFQGHELLKYTVLCLFRRAIPLKPYISSFLINMVWSSTLKAFDKSMKTPSV